MGDWHHLASLLLPLGGVCVPARLGFALSWFSYALLALVGKSLVGPTAIQIGVAVKVGVAVERGVAAKVGIAVGKVDSGIVLKARRGDRGTNMIIGLMQMEVG